MARFIASNHSHDRDHLMSIAGAVVVYVLCWWFCFFMALPFGARPLKNPEVGHAESAPANPRLKLKALIATIGGLVMTIVIWQIIESDLISFYQPQKS